MGTYFKKIEGERLYLSPVDPSDAEVFAVWVNDLEVGIHTQAAPHLYSLPAERAQLEKMAREGTTFAIVLREEDRPIGVCGLGQPDMLNRNATLGIIIGEKGEWNKGYGTEAMRLLLEFGFDFLNLNNIMLTVFAYNTRAIACYRKVGFREIGARRQAKMMGGKFYDMIYMDVLASEFQSKRAEGLVRASQNVPAESIKGQTDEPT